jgi:uncharacterized Fe-S cluster-containing protein
VNKVIKGTEAWLPPGKNCGLCGSDSCENFIKDIKQRQKEYTDCPFYLAQKNTQPKANVLNEAIYAETDLLGNAYDFILKPLPGEISARKIVLPFRGDLVEKLAIGKEDIVLGRPMGAGCPVQHVLKVIEADYTTGLLYTWVVGPQYSRNHAVKDVSAYHMIGFEGIAAEIRRSPEFGRRVTFLPGFCMMNLNHTGLVNLVLQKTAGCHVRLEDIRILAG